MKIKPLYAVLLVTALVLLAVGVTLYFTWEAPEQTSQPQSYTPTYTADQVIAIAQAKYPACFKQELIGQDSGGMFRYQTVDTPTQISVQFVGGTSHAWKVVITCPVRYLLQDRTTGKTLYFWETDGALHNTFYP